MLLPYESVVSGQHRACRAVFSVVGLVLVLTLRKTPLKPFTLKTSCESTIAVVHCWEAAAAPGSLLLHSSEHISAKEKEKKEEHYRNVVFALTNAFLKCDYASNRKACVETQLKFGKVQALVL